MKLLLYCTKEKKQKDLLWSNNLKHFFLDGAYNRLIDNLPTYLLNGKIIAECDFEVEEIMIGKSITVGFGEVTFISTPTLQLYDLSNNSCLSGKEIENYLGDKKGYAIHIKNLHIFDEPKELSEYYTKKKNNVEENEDLFMDGILYTTIKSAPQNMMYAKQPLKEDKIIISIRPEWLCKILNGDKTIEVRKKVLKEMTK